MEDRTKVVEFLKKHNTPFTTFIRARGSIGAYIDPIDPRWEGSIPTSYLFDRSGKQVGRAIVGARSYADLEKMILPLLDQQP